MYYVISAIIILISVVLIMIVLVQNSKGGGLSAGFSSAGQMTGVRKTADFLEKATWTMAGALIVLSVISSFVIPRANEEVKKSKLEEQVNNSVEAPMPGQNFPSAPAPAPAQ